MYFIEVDNFSKKIIGLFSWKCQVLHSRLPKGNRAVSHQALSYLCTN